MRTSTQLDPDVPVLREMLGKMQAAVKAGGITPRAANDAMGKLADSLIANRRAAAFKSKHKIRH